MRSRTLVIIGLFLIAVGVVGVVGWVVSAALDLSDSALRLSVFEPHAGGCAWYEQGPDGADEKQVTRFSVDCSKVQVSWDLSGAAAVVWFPDDDLASQDELLYLVDVTNRKARRLMAAEPGEPSVYAIGEDDRILAFTENQQINVVSPNQTEDEGEDKAPETSEIEYQGKRYPSSHFPEGQDVLVHALELRGGVWQDTETKASRCCAEGAPGVAALNSYQNYLKDTRLGERQSARVLTATGAFAEIPSTSSVVVKAREKLKIDADESDAPWLSLKPAGWRKGIVFRATRTGDRHATGAAVFSEGESLQRIPGFNFRPGDVLQLMTRGRYLLVTEWGSGMQPHLYDMQTGQLLYSSTVATGVTFWPEPWAESAKGIP